MSDMSALVPLNLKIMNFENEGISRRREAMEMLTIIEEIGARNGYMGSRRQKRRIRIISPLLH